MEYLSVRDLRSSKEVWETLSQDGELVLTNNGKPQALVIEVDSSTLDETVAALKQAKAMRLVNSIRLDSIKNGTNKMSMEDIDAEIRAARNDRKTGRAGNE